LQVKAYFNGLIDVNGQKNVQCKPAWNDCYWSATVATAADASGYQTVNWQDGSALHRRVHVSNLYVWSNKVQCSVGSSGGSNKACGTCCSGVKVKAYFNGLVDKNGKKNIQCVPSWNECYWPATVASSPDTNGYQTVNWEDGSALHRKVRTSYLRVWSTNKVCSGGSTPRPTPRPSPPPADNVRKYAGSFAICCGFCNPLAAKTYSFAGCKSFDYGYVASYDANGPRTCTLKKTGAGAHSVDSDCTSGGTTSTTSTVTATTSTTTSTQKFNSTAASAPISGANDPQVWKFFRFNPSALRADSANSLQISEMTFRSGGKLISMTGAVATNPGGKNPSGEGADKAIDGKTSTKWLDFNKKGLVVEFPATFPDEVSITTANDSPSRDPVSFRFEGSRDGVSWTKLFKTPGGQVPFARLTQTAWFGLKAETTPPVTATSSKSMVETLKLTVKNLDYQKLLGNPTVKAKFIAAVKKAIAMAGLKALGTVEEKVGCPPDKPCRCPDHSCLAKHITLKLSSGSVVVDATIDTAAAGLDHGKLKASLTSAKSAVERRVLAEVKSIPSISSMMANPSIPFAVASEAAPTKPQTASSSIALECSSGFVVGIFLAVSAFRSEL